MSSFPDITSENFQDVVDFLIREASDQNTKKAFLKDGDLAALITFLEEKYQHELIGQQIEDIYIHPEEKKLYIETGFDPDNLDEYILCIDEQGILKKELLTPDHVLFDLYAEEDDDEQ